MRRLEITIKVIIAVLAFSFASRTYQLMAGEPVRHALLSLGLVAGLLVLCIVWLRAVKAKSQRVRPMTILFMGIPVLAGLVQIVFVWNDKEGIVFKSWVTICIAVVVAIYLKYVSGWMKRLFSELEGNSS